MGTLQREQSRSSVSQSGRCGESFLDHLSDPGSVCTLTSLKSDAPPGVSLHFNLAILDVIKSFKCVKFVQGASLVYLG